MLNNFIAFHLFTYSILHKRNVNGCLRNYVAFTFLKIHLNENSRIYSLRKETRGKWI